MACINPDGTLTPIAQKVLTAMTSSGNLAEISQTAGIPFYRVRSSIRELSDMGLIDEDNGFYKLTDNGKVRLGLSS
jgi:predicted transcriptional regulator